MARVDRVDLLDLVLLLDLRLSLPLPVDIQLLSNVPSLSARNETLERLDDGALYT